MKLKNITVVMLALLLLQGVLPVTGFQKAEASETEAIFDVEMICEKVFKENGQFYACIDFNCDAVSEVSAGGEIVVSGTALHHVIVPVVLQEELEITALVNDGEDCYETAFYLYPTIDDFETEETSENGPDHNNTNNFTGKPSGGPEEELTESGIKTEKDEKKTEEYGASASAHCLSESLHPEKENEETSSAAGHEREDGQPVDGEGETSISENTTPFEQTQAQMAASFIKTERAAASSDVEAEETDGEENPSDSGPSFSSDTSSDVTIEYIGASPQNTPGEETAVPQTRTESEDQIHTGYRVIHQSAEENENSVSAMETRTFSDGSYLATSFQWSGGSGRLKGIRCDLINITCGQATAEMVFLSGHYRYVKLDGKVYYPSSQTEEETIFDLPVVLNQRLEITAMTDAMSQPHEISYTIYIGLDGIRKETDREIYSYYGEVIQLEDAYRFPGLDYLGSLKIKEAKDFRIHLYDNDLTVLEIQNPVSDLSDSLNAETVPVKETPTAEAKLIKEGRTETPEPDDLYARRTLRYLFIPEGAEIPVGIEKELILVQKPIDAAYLDIDLSSGILEEPYVLSKLFAVSDSEKLKSLKQLKEKIEEGKIVVIDGEEKLSMKELLLGKCDLVLISSDKLEKKELWEQLSTDLSMLKIPLIPDCTNREKTSAAQKEWQIVIKMLFDWQA